MPSASAPGRHFDPPEAFIFTEGVSSPGPDSRAVRPATATIAPCSSALAGASSSPGVATERSPVFRHHVAGQELESEIIVLILVVNQW